MYKTLNAPLTVHLDLLTACNQKCLHCYNYWRTDTNYDDTYLSFSQANHIIEQLVKNEVFHVILNGGEPLLNKDILFHIIRELKNKNISFGLNSNATLITQSTAQELKNAGLTSILISLLSFDENTHHYLTNSKNTYSKALNGIKNCINAGLHVAINMVVTKKNLNHVLQTGRFLKKIGIKNFNATRVITPMTESHVFPETLALSIDNVLTLAEYLVELNSEGINVSSLIPYPVCFFNSSKSYSILGNKTCSAGITSSAIASDGEVRACPHLSFSYGNIFKTEFSDIWQKMGDWRDGSLVSEDCRNCYYFHRCGGGCKITSKTNNICNNDVLMNTPLHNQNEIFTTHSDEINLTLNSVLEIKRDIKFRKDNCVGIIYSGFSKSILVTHDTYDIFKTLWGKKQSFNLQNLQQDYSINMNNKQYFKFINQMIKKKLLRLIN